MKKKFLEKFRKKIFFFRFFQYYSHIFWLKSIFSGKITILSYKTIFGHAFSLISENLVVQFFSNSKKTVILGQNGHFSAHLAKIGQNEKFYQKSGRAIFLPLLSPNFMPSFRKMVRAVSEINSLDPSIRPYIQWNLSRRPPFKTATSVRRPLFHSPNVKVP